MVLSFGKKWRNVLTLLVSLFFARVIVATDGFSGEQIEAWEVRAARGESAAVLEETRVAASKLRERPAASVEEVRLWTLRARCAFALARWPESAACLRHVTDSTFVSGKERDAVEVQLARALSFAGDDRAALETLTRQLDPSARR